MWPGALTATPPPGPPGAATTSPDWATSFALKNGRTSVGNTEESAANFTERWPRKKNEVSRAQFRSQSSHQPMVNRPPEKTSCDSAPDPPNSTAAPGVPSTPVETSGGELAPRVHHSKYSALA